MGTATLEAQLLVLMVPPLAVLLLLEAQRTDPGEACESSSIPEVFNGPLEYIMGGPVRLREDFREGHLGLAFYGF